MLSARSCEPSTSRSTWPPSAPRMPVCSLESRRCTSGTCRTRLIEGCCEEALNRGGRRREVSRGMEKIREMRASRGELVFTGVWCKRDVNDGWGA